MSSVMAMRVPSHSWAGCVLFIELCGLSSCAACGCAALAGLPLPGVGFTCVVVRFPGVLDEGGAVLLAERLVDLEQRLLLLLVDRRIGEDRGRNLQQVLPVALIEDPGLHVQRLRRDP